MWNNQKWKCRLENGGHFVSASVCWSVVMPSSQHHFDQIPDVDIHDAKEEELPAVTNVPWCTGTFFRYRSGFLRTQNVRRFEAGNAWVNLYFFNEFVLLFQDS